MEIIHSLERIARLLEAADDIIISAHIGPDGDAIGSVCAMLTILKNRGKRVYALLETFPDKFRQIPGAHLIMSKWDESILHKTFIALDCADKNRLGRFAKYFDASEVTINIDHHVSNDNFAMYNYVNPEASATAEIIFQLVNSDKGLNEAFNLDAASALYAGILYDTGGFRHPSTTSDTYFAAGELIKLGVDFSGIYKRQFATKRFEELQITAVALSKMKRAFDNRFVWTSVTKDELLSVSATLGDLDGVVDLVKSTEGSQVAVFFYEKANGEFKASFRSDRDLDVSAIAVKFGGGGHKNAAGCSFLIPLNEAVDAVTKEIEILLGRSD